MIVVDVGAMLQGPEESTRKLIGRFQPELLFAFDPHPGFVEGVERVEGTVVVSRRAAAWTLDGYVGLAVDGICTGVDHGGIPVRCFDLAAWLWTLPLNESIVLKLDAEGAEYPLLYEVGLSSVDAYLERVIVEWHPPETSHGFYTDDRPMLRCPVEEWD